MLKKGKGVVIQTLNTLKKTTTYIIWSNAEFELKSPTPAVIIPTDSRPASVWPL